MKRMVLLFLLTAIVFPRTYATEPSIDVNNYQWKGSAIILKTSQVFDSSADRVSCGKQDYEVCVGSAEPKTGVTPAPTPAAITVKCFIPKNQTVCPPIKAEERCFVAGVGTPADPASRPQCDNRAASHGKYDNLTFGCNCAMYGRPKDIRPTGAMCEREMRDRMAREAARAAAARATADADAARASAAACTNGSWNSDHTICICAAHFHPNPPANNCVADPTTVCHAGFNLPNCLCNGVFMSSGGTCAAADPIAVGSPTPTPTPTPSPESRACINGYNIFPCTCNGTVVPSGSVCAQPEGPLPLPLPIAPLTCDNGTMVNGQCQCYQHYVPVNGICQLEAGNACASATYDACSAPNADETTCH